MVYNEGKSYSESMSPYDSVFYMLESYENQRNIDKYLAESAISLEIAKHRCLNEATQQIMTSETAEDAYNHLLDTIAKLGKFLWRLLKNAVLWIKSNYIRDNEKMVRIYGEKYDAISVEFLSNFTYHWSEPTKKLLSFINGNTNSDDLDTVWSEALTYTAIVVSPNNKNNSTPFTIDQKYNTLSNMTQTLLGTPYNTIETFRSAYSLSLLDSEKRQVGITHERKNLIKDSLISYKLVGKLEGAIRSQQKNVESLLNKIEEIKSRHKEDEVCWDTLVACRDIVNTLNSIAVVVANCTVEAINVYEFQCKKIFTKIIAYYNRHEDY